MFNVRLAGVAGILAVAAACSSSSSNGGSGKGTTSSGEASGACAALSTYTVRCGGASYVQSQACTTALEQACSATLSVYTPAFQQAIVACNTSATDCNNGPGACYDQQMASVQPTAAQAKVRTDYCNGCPAETNCAATFFTMDPVNGDGIGVPLLQLTDAIAEQVDAACTGNALLDAGDGTDCTSAFGSCLAQIVANAQPDQPDVCTPTEDGGSEDAGEDAGDDGGEDAGDAALQGGG
jgi:hypothetical protein